MAIPYLPYRPTICVDFDNCLHSYTSGWQGADVVSDPPTDGALDWVYLMLSHHKALQLAVHSSRSGQPGGIDAMRCWLQSQFEADGHTHEYAWMLVDQIEWPKHKPPALVTIDDRALTFDGCWWHFTPERLLTFKPWNHKKKTP